MNDIMIEIVELKPTLSNARGILQEVDFCDYKQLNILTSYESVIRGRHYHKKLKEYFIVLNGSADLHLRDVSTGEEQRLLVKTGDSFIIPVLIWHSLEFHEDTVMIVGYSEYFDTENPDIYE